MSKLKIALSLLLLFFTSAKLIAQETTSEIQGTVTDDKGKPVASASVVAVHGPSGTRYTTTTRNDGRFNLAGLRVGGPYLITVSFVGYKTETQDSITLLVGQEFTADFQLKPELKQLTEVVVTSTRQDKLFSSSHTGSQEVITHAEILQLPTVNRSLSDFTRLEPTANPTSFGTSFGGRSAQYNNITVDGANFNNGFGLSSTLGGQTHAEPISPESIDQIQVNVAPYDVRQGGFTGAGVNAITKSGTNQFRGTLYDYIKGPNTEGYNVEDTKVPKSPFSFYTRGGSLGGPIIKNKLFFFVNYEKVKQTAPAYTVVASGGPTNLAPNPGVVSQANADSLNALAAFLKSKFNYDPGAYQGYSFASASKKITARIDWNIDSKSTLTLKYNYLRSYSEQPQSTSRAGNGFAKGPANFSYTYGLPFSGSKYVINNNFDIYLAELNTRFSNKLSNKFQIGYTKERDPRAPGVPGTTMPMVDIYNGSFNGNVYASFGYETYTYNNLINTDVYQASDIATLYKGAHEITFGTQDYSRKYADAFVPSFAGSYVFPTLTDFYNAANGTGPYTDKYYQQWSNIPGGAFPFYYAGSTEIGLFIQDKWRATQNFTLTYGLRYDMTLYKSLFLDNPYFDALTFKDGASYNIGKAPGNAILISPRVGFNWDVKGDKTTQVRGGFGIFSGPPPFVWLANQGGNNGVLIAGGNYSNVPFTADAVKSPPPPVNTTPPSTVQSATSYGAAVTDKNFKYPTIIKSSLALDKKFKNDWIATIEASYSKDINAVYFSNLNLNESNAFAMTGADNRLRYLTSTPNSNKYYYGNGGATQSNPNISSAILMKNSSKGYAYTLTARIQKTFNNLFVSLAYTYSQSKNLAAGGSTASTLWSSRGVANADPNGANLAYSDYYQPHRVIAYGSYRVAYGKYFSTSIGAVFQAAPAGVGSYFYSGDLNGDGNTGNDLIYIPKSASEINLIDVGSYNSVTHTGTTTGTASDPRTSAQIWTQLNNFINQDHYLSAHRGQYAQANAVVYPFFKDLDLNITQDIYYYTKIGKEKDKHTLRLTLDLVNVGNFLNKNWGLVKQQNTSTPLTFEGMAADGTTPLFSFPYADKANQVPLVNSFSNNTSIISRWQMQFGIRYLFN
ncbi:MAG TPA: carboxypeptidase regulatory-like domain-containing protein [Chitinophagaceae bacterium]|nr:carboxypeptidase regulatory-like domain-containing protein [Chitinophagaceae bacterium]